MLPGAERLVRHLHACGVKMAIGTSTSAASFAAKRHALGDLCDLFPVIVTGDQARRNRTFVSLQEYSRNIPSFVGTFARSVQLTFTGMLSVAAALKPVPLRSCRYPLVTAQPPSLDRYRQAGKRAMPP